MDQRSCAVLLMVKGRLKPAPSWRPLLSEPAPEHSEKQKSVRASIASRVETVEPCRALISHGDIRVLSGKIAEECDRFAQWATTDHQRHLFKRMAAAWEEKADEEEQKKL